MNTLENDLEIAFVKGLGCDLTKRGAVTTDRALALAALDWSETKNPFYFFKVYT